MIVYGDILVAENFIIGGALLYITAQIHTAGISQQKGRLRFLAGAVMCGLFSLIIFLPVKTPVTLLMEAAFAPAVCYIVFGRRKVWQKALTFLLVTYFMGGFTMALLLATRNYGIYTAAGIYTGDMKAGFLALFMAAALFTSKKVITVVRERKFYQQHVFDVIIWVDGESIKVRGFLDTGNGLFDPVSGRPVAVAGENLWRRFEERGMLRENRVRMIPYEAVGSSGILMGMRTDYTEAGGNRIKGCIIARADGALKPCQDAAADHDLLLSRDMIDGKL